jgi:hypothetical protein
MKEGIGPSGMWLSFMLLRAIAAAQETPQPPVALHLGGLNPTPRRHPRSDRRNAAGGRCQCDLRSYRLHPAKRRQPPCQQVLPTNHRVCRRRQIASALKDRANSPNVAGSGVAEVAGTVQLVDGLPTHQLVSVPPLANRC